jgi:hypothetical protein
VFLSWRRFKNLHVLDVVKIVYDSLKGDLPFLGIYQGITLRGGNGLTGGVNDVALLFDLGRLGLYYLS